MDRALGADLAGAVERYLRWHVRLAERLWELETRLYRVHQMMLAWEDWQVEQERPLPLRRRVEPPLLAYESLRARRAHLLDRLAELEARTADRPAGGECRAAGPLRRRRPRNQ